MENRQYRSFFNVSLLAALLLPALNAGADVLSANVADASVSKLGTITGVDNANVRVGTSASEARALIIPFLLPDLGALSAPFDEASFQFAVQFAHSNKFPAGVGVNLEGLTSTRSDATVLGTDYAASAVLLQGNILGNADPVGIYQSNLAGNAALVNWLNDAYAGGTNSGKYVFIRLTLSNDSVVLPSASGYNIYTANATDATLRPQISYSPAVPEPAVAGAVIALVSFGVIAISRRKRK